MNKRVWAFALLTGDGKLSVSDRGKGWYHMPPPIKAPLVPPNAGPAAPVVDDHHAQVPPLPPVPAEPDLGALGALRWALGRGDSRNSPVIPPANGRPAMRREGIDVLELHDPILGPPDAFTRPRSQEIPYLTPDWEKLWAKGSLSGIRNPFCGIDFGQFENTFKPTPPNISISEQSLAELAAISERVSALKARIAELIGKPFPDEPEVGIEFRRGFIWTEDRLRVALDMLKSFNDGKVPLLVNGVESDQLAIAQHVVNLLGVHEVSLSVGGPGLNELVSVQDVEKVISGAAGGVVILDGFNLAKPEIKALINDYVTGTIPRPENTRLVLVSNAFDKAITSNEIRPFVSEILPHDDLSRWFERSHFYIGAMNLFYMDTGRSFGPEGDKGGG